MSEASTADSIRRMIETGWRAPLLWRLRSTGTLPRATSAYGVAGAFRGALLEALADEGWLIAEDRAGRPASILAIPSMSADRVVAVGVAPQATVAEDALPILHRAADQVAEDGFGRRLNLGPPLQMGRLVGPSRRWRTLTPWIALKSLSRGGTRPDGRKRSGRERTPETLLQEAVGRALNPDAMPAQAIDAAASMLTAIEITPRSETSHARDWMQPQSSRPPYTAFTRIELREALQGPILIGRGQRQGCGMLIADD